MTKSQRNMSQQTVVRRYVQEHPALTQEAHLATVRIAQATTLWRRGERERAEQMLTDAAASLTAVQRRVRDMAVPDELESAHAVLDRGVSSYVAGAETALEGAKDCYEDLFFAAGRMLGEGTRAITEATACLSPSMTR